MGLFNLFKKEEVEIVPRKEITPFECSSKKLIDALKTIDLDNQWIETIIYNYNGEMHYIGMVSDSGKALYVYDGHLFLNIDDMIQFSFSKEDKILEILGVGVFLEKEFLNTFIYEIECDIREYEEIFELIK